MSLFSRYVFSLVIFLIFPVSLLADSVEDQKQVDVMSSLANSTLAGSALKATLQAVLDIKKTDAFNNAKAMEAMEVFRRSSKPVDEALFGYISFQNLYDSEQTLNAIKLEKISAVKKYSKLKSTIDSAALPLDILDLGQNTYDFVQNFSKAIDSEGNVWTRTEAGAFATKNVIDAYQASTAIASTVVKFAPKSTVANFWANNALAKGVSSGGKYAKGAGALGAITIGAQIESIIYQHFRDGAVNEIKDNIFSIYKTSIDSRKNIASALTELYFEHLNAGTLIGAGEIVDLLSVYGVHRPTYSGFAGNTYQLSQLFLDNVADTEYLSRNYSQTDFTDLSNTNRIMVALDALVNISTKEDAEIVAYLEETVTNGASVADVIFGAFEGSSIYEIYDTQSLLQKMFPYFYSDTSGFEYYYGLYKIAFNAEVVSYMQQRLAEFGREVRRLKDAAALKEARDAEFSRLLEIPATQEGDKVAVTIGLEVDYRDEVHQAALLNLPFRFRYQDSEGTKVIDAIYDQGTGQLVFDAPTTESIKLYEVLMPRAPRWEGDTDAGYSSYTLPVGKKGVFAEVYKLINQNNTCTDSPTNSICKIGPFLAKSVRLDGSVSISTTDNSLFALTQFGIDIYDIKNPVIPLYVSTLPIPLSINEGWGAQGSIATYQDFMIVARGEAGAFFIDIKNKKNPRIISSYSDGTNITDVEVVNDVIYLASSSGLKVVDFTVPEAPILIKTIDIGAINSFKLSNKYLIAVPDQRRNAHNIFDISIPGTPKLIEGSFGLEGKTSFEIAILGDIIFLSAGGRVATCDMNKGLLNGKFQCETSSDFATDGRINIYGGYAYIGSKVIDLRDPSKLKVVATLNGNCSKDFYSGGWSNDVMAIAGNYAYCLQKSNELHIYNLNSKENSYIFDTAIQSATDIEVFNNRLYVSKRGEDAFSGRNNSEIFNITDPLAPQFISNYESNQLMSRLGDKFFFFDHYARANVIDNNEYSEFNYLGDKGIGVNAFQVDKRLYLNTFKGVNVYDITNEGSWIKLGSFEFRNMTFHNADSARIMLEVYNGFVFTKDEYGRLIIIDFNNPAEPINVSHSIKDYGSVTGALVYGNYLYLGTSYETKVIDISNPSSPNEINSIDATFTKAIVDGHYAFLVGTKLKIVNLIEPQKPKILNKYFGQYEAKSVALSGKYAFLMESFGKISVIDWMELIRLQSSLNTDSISELTLFAENSFSNNTYTENDLVWHVREEIFEPYIGNDEFSKELVFNKPVDTQLIFKIDESTYQNTSWLSNGNITRKSNLISIPLWLNRQLDINTFNLRIMDDKDKSIKINGQNFKDIPSRIIDNNLPRLADAQPTQMVGISSEPVTMLINTFDADGDAVSLSVLDDDGGYVFFGPNEPNRLFASFSSDDKAVHTVKIALNDGKETVEKSITVLRLDHSAINALYSDVDKNSSIYSFSDIAFVTKQGVFSGQPDPSDPQLRIFRPNDNASMAEVLKVIINAGVKTNRLSLESSASYLKTFPNWASPYYTYARESGAVDDLGGDLSILYPTREQLAQLLAKLLQLDEKIAAFDSITVDFDDKDSFSNDAMHRYGQIIKIFGLYLVDDNALPQQKVTRAELAGVIKKIFMMPSAELVVSSDPVKLGDFFGVSLKNIKAEEVATDFSLVDSSENVSSDFVINNRRVLFSSVIDTYDLNLGENQVVVMIDNNGVRDIISKFITLTNPKQVFTFNVDGSTEGGSAQPAKPLTDGLLILRYMFGFSGDALIANAVDENAIRKSASDIQTYLQLGIDEGALDIDGNGEVKPLTDGLLVLRYLFGFRGESLINNAIGENATRSAANDVETYLEQLMGQ